MQRPETRYAWNGDAALAYQTMGTGGSDLMLQIGFASHLDVNWESPHLASFFRGLAEGRRLIVSDRRGMGLSERYAPDHIPPLEVTADDLLAVMDDAGSERAILMATGWAGFTASYLAAAHPERVAGLVVWAYSPTFSAAPDTPWVWSHDVWADVFEAALRGWGRREFADYLGVTYLDERELDWFVRWCGAANAPGAAAHEVRHWVHTDVRPILHLIQAPTLILADQEATDESGEAAGRYLQGYIPGAKVVPLRGANQNLWYRGAREALDAISRFVLDLRAEAAMFDRVLATVLFTDIVDSTAHAASMGDQAWRATVERHHTTVRALLARFRGAEVDTAGDGFFATFDGPARAVRCAQAIIEAVRPLGIEVRAGIHAGEVETIDGKAGGVAVMIGARAGAKAAASEILATSTVKDLTAGSDIVFEDAGSHELKGIPEPWRLFRVTG